jgi:hypothetical protein
MDFYPDFYPIKQHLPFTKHSVFLGFNIVPRNTSETFGDFE